MGVASILLHVLADGSEDEYCPQESTDGDRPHSVIGIYTYPPDVPTPSLPTYMQISLISFHVDQDVVTSSPKVIAQCLGRIPDNLYTGTLRRWRSSCAHMASHSMPHRSYSVALMDRLYFY